MDGTSILAKNGDEPYEYGSNDLRVLLHNLENPGSTIGGHGMETMPYQDYVFSDFGNACTKAMVLALAIDRLREIK